MDARLWAPSYGDIPLEIDADAHRSVTHMLEHAMRTFADRPAFRSFGQTLTYADIDRLSRDFAAYLQQTLGIAKGDRVAVMSPNLLAFPIAFLGIIRAGAVQVSVNPFYTPRELEHQLRDSNVGVILAYSGSTGVVAEVAQKVALTHVITICPGDGTSVDLPAAPIDPRLHATVSFREALAMGAKLQFEQVDLTGDDLLLLQYTGGTTGLSKGAALTHRNLVANTEQFKAFTPTATRPGQEVIVTALPLYHIFALMVNFITYFSIGADNWLVTDPRDTDALIDILRASKPTSFMGVNTLYTALATHPGLKDVDFSNLRLAGGGGAAIIPATSTRWQQVTGTFIREGYGLSETGPVLTFNPHYIETFNGTAGLPLPSTDIQLLTADGQRAAQGQSGEICAKGPQIMRGYWNQPEANHAAFTADGYFLTGDIGVFDEKGFLRIVDRVKDMIIVSGFNVYPNEVEAVAAACAGVAECACIGEPDEKTGEAVRLFVVRVPSSALTENQIVEHCRHGLAAYKVPRTVTFVETLPKSTVGKMLRRELRHR
ncbi:AMP-binding protein [Paraburkholderia agricolaris]|uniref:AMP-binding protein n=1 Tax=Paraburkholderia agricolaris TaxID=2152888 RepID=UPI001FE2AE87|nr:AMP-binding protein [Paraburkholderia agricolaris]